MNALWTAVIAGTSAATASRTCRLVTDESQERWDLRLRLQRDRELVGDRHRGSPLLAGHPTSVVGNQHDLAQEHTVGVDVERDTGGRQHEAVVHVPPAVHVDASVALDDRQRVVHAGVELRRAHARASPPAPCERPATPAQLAAPALTSAPTSSSERIERRCDRRVALCRERATPNSPTASPTARMSPP